MNKLEFFCITPELCKNGVSVKIHSAAPAVRVTYKISAAESTCAASGEADAIDGAFFTELKDAHLRTIEDPYLYTMSAEIEFSGGSVEFDVQHNKIYPGRKFARDFSCAKTPALLTRAGVLYLFLFFR